MTSVQAASGSSPGAAVLLLQSMQTHDANGRTSVAVCGKLCSFVVCIAAIGFAMGDFAAAQQFTNGGRVQSLGARRLFLWQGIC